MTRSTETSSKALIVIQCSQEEGNGTLGNLVRHYGRESGAGMVVDAEMQEFPSDSIALAHAGVASGDPMAGSVETRQFLDAGMEPLAGSVALVAMRRREEVDVPDPFNPRRWRVRLTVEAEMWSSAVVR